MRRILPLIAGALLLPGCVAAAVAVGAAATYGTVKYVENDISRDFPADLDTTWAASKGALADLGYGVDAEAARGPTEGKLETADVEMAVKQRPDGVTRVSVRVGTFETSDHRRRATLILDGVARRLGGAAPEATPVSGS